MKCLFSSSRQPWVLNNRHNLCGLRGVFCSGNLFCVGNSEKMVNIQVTFLIMKERRFAYIRKGVMMMVEQMMFPT